MVPTTILLVSRLIATTLLALMVPPAPPGVGAPSPAECQPATGYRPPVAAPVTDPFRAPPSPFGPGNRGLEYGTPPGSAVAAIGSGVVVFAGQVGGKLFVTVRHADGLRSSYSYLATMAVRAGDVVARGALLGTSGSLFHLGVRCGATYLDPSALFESVRHARLVPDRRFPVP